MKSKTLNSHNKKETKKPHMIPLLSLAVIASFSLALWTISILDWEDRVTIYRGLLLSAYGAVFFTSSYSLINHVTQRTNYGLKLCKKYKLSTADVLDTSNKIVSAVQALLSCLTGIIIICYSCPRNLLKTSHYISEAYAWFGASYFMYDIWSMYQVYYHATQSNMQQNGEYDIWSMYQVYYHATQSNMQQNGELKIKKTKDKESAGKFWYYIKTNPVIVGHHLFIGLFGFSVIVYLRGGLGDCVFGYVYLMEASTPFVSLRGILARMNLKTSRLYVANGLLMLAVFFLCRIAMFPYVMYLYAAATDLDYVSALISLPRGCKATMAILVLPQVYWFYLMMKGATKILKFRMVSSTTTPLRVIARERRIILARCITDRANLFSELYEKHKTRLQIVLVNIGTHLPHIVDVKWDTDYIVKTSGIDEVGGPIFRITLFVENFNDTKQENEIDKIDFSCTCQELQDLVYRLKEAARHCQKIAEDLVYRLKEAARHCQKIAVGH
ncbi:COMM domain [Popillia japonica]|uniref:COMM domain n=1 Tax=Popillia japonica TaxID=7064 RepID=A0AAW1N6E1_POPJA